MRTCYYIVCMCVYTYIFLDTLKNRLTFLEQFESPSRSEQVMQRLSPPRCPLNTLPNEESGHFVTFVPHTCFGTCFHSHHAHKHTHAYKYKNCF